MKTALTTIVLFILNIFTSAPSRADIVQVQPGRWLAAIPSDQFQFWAAPQQNGRQRQQNWCWAACIQMVLNYHGLYVTQEQIVQRIFGQLIDQPGDAQMILTALSGWAPDARGRYSTIHATPYVLRGSDIVRDLANRWPLIVGLRGDPVGHAYVLTGVYYTVDQYNEPVFQSVILRDPWPTTSSRNEMSWGEFERKLMFMARVSVSRQ